MAQSMFPCLYTVDCRYQVGIVQLKHSLVFNHEPVRQQSVCKALPAGQRHSVGSETSLFSRASKHTLLAEAPEC